MSRRPCPLRPGGYDVVFGSRNAGAALAGKVVIDAVGWENFADPLPGANLFFAADPDARPVAEELITAVGLDPAFVGDAGASGTVDALLPLWFALVKQHDGNRRLALRIVQ
jgi:predicted dinucleotide-binding enzyme